MKVTDKWVSKARSGELAIVQSHKEGLHQCSLALLPGVTTEAKVVVRHVASQGHTVSKTGPDQTGAAFSSPVLGLDISLPPEERAVWASETRLCPRTWSQRTWRSG